MNFYQHITSVITDSFNKNLNIYIDKFADVLIEKNNGKKLIKEEIINIWNEVFGSNVKNEKSNDSSKCAHTLKNGNRCGNKSTKNEYCGRHFKSHGKEEEIITCIHEKKDGELCGKKSSKNEDGEQTEYCSRQE